IGPAACSRFPGYGLGPVVPFGATRWFASFTVGSPLRRRRRGRHVSRAAGVPVANRGRVGSCCQCAGHHDPPPPPPPPPPEKPPPEKPLDPLPPGAAAWLAIQLLVFVAKWCMDEK